MKTMRKTNPRSLGSLAGLLGAAIPFLLVWGVNAQEVGKAKPAQDGTQAEVLPTDPQARIDWADGKKKEMENLRRRIQKMLDAARAEHDIIAVNCLNDKLSQANANMASFSDHLNDFRKAVSAADKVQQEHEFTLMTVLYQKQNTIAGEANGCVGEEAGYLGETELSTTIDDNITSADPTSEPNQGVDATVDVRPPEASAKE